MRICRCIISNMKLATLSFVSLSSLTVSWRQIDVMIHDKRRKFNKPCEVISRVVTYLPGYGEARWLVVSSDVGHLLSY